MSFSVLITMPGIVEGQTEGILGVHGAERMECWAHCIFMAFNPGCTCSEEFSKNIDADPPPDQLNPDLWVWFLGNCYF